METLAQLQFVALINDHRSLIYTIVNQYCKDANYRDDLYQDILTRAWKAYQTFRWECTFKTWICNIARYTAIDRLRRLKNNVISVANNNIFYSIIDEPYLEKSLPAIDSLSPTEQRTLNLALDGLSYTMISDILNEPENRIRVRMHRIKARLSKHIKQYYEY
jgi:RNA polymerase sigma-70 factor (ECF subfamily)